MTGDVMYFHLLMIVFAGKWTTLGSHTFSSINHV